MADGIEVPESAKKIARIGIYHSIETLHEEVKDQVQNQGLTVDEAIDGLGLREFIENQIAVKAANEAYIEFLVRVLHEPEA